MTDKAPIWKRTFEFIHRLAAHTSFGRIAQCCGKKLQVAEAWGRRPPSIDFPSGTGKKNPFDCVLRLIGEAYSNDPGLAAEMAEMFVEYVAWRDAQAGRAFVAGGGSVLALMASSIKEHADVAYELLNKPDPDFDKVWKEFEEAEVVWRRLKAGIVAIRQKRMDSLG